MTDLWADFCSPPDDARPRVWWHWMDGNVDLEGIRLDLEWLHRVGVRGVQMFQGGMGTPLVVPEPVEHGSPAWAEAVRFATQTADRLGLEFAVATSPGWSAAGGPWVAPVDAMKKVVWSETVVDGGPVDLTLAPLPDVAGPYQDCPRWGADPAAQRYSRDWVVLAVPADPAQETLTPTALTASAPVADWTPLSDGSFGSAVELPRDPDGWSTAWIVQSFDRPVAVSTITVGLPGPLGFAAAPPPDAGLDVSDDGSHWVRVADLPVTGVPVRTVSFASVTARHFRLVLSAESAAAALPELAEGVTLPPVMRRMSSFLVSEFALRPGARVSQAEVKAGFGVVPDYYALDADVAVDGIDPAQVVDLTASVSGGRLVWDAPPGRWRVLRFGASLTGQTNGPAPASATGLEVDKLDGAKVRSYLDDYLAFFDGVVPADQLDALLSDSIESGCQNWTDALLDRFADLRGYDPRGWLPALAGQIVGDAAASDRFLYDYRRTVADLLAEDFYGTIAKFAHERGLAYYAEALEDHRPQLGDDLAMRARADVPMGAMWTWDAGAGTPKPTYVADVKGASSVAHVWAKAYTGAESMSSFHRPWSYTPKQLKHVADLELALGVTRFCLHTSPHQPSTTPAPGIGLSPYLAQTFIRSETWADSAGPWIDYLARCSYLLNLGEPVAHVAYFVGEEAPVTSLFGDRLVDAVPTGFDYDFVDLEALEDRVTVDGGRLVAGSASYRVLFLGGASARLTVRALRRIAELVEGGATVVGARPVDSSSLADDAAEHRTLCDRLWPAAGPSTGSGHGPSSGWGNAGRIVDTDDLGAVLGDLGVEPELRVEGAELVSVARRINGRLVNFLSNPRTEPAAATVVVPGAARLDAWDAVEVRRSALAEVDEAGAGRFALELPPLGSVFVLVVEADALPGGPELTVAVAEPDCSSESAEPTLALDGGWRLTVPGHRPIDLAGGPRPWTEVGTELLGFSGTATYRTEVVLDHPPATAWLELGEVGDLARVRVNDRDCGVAWTYPFRVEVGGALREGGNVIEVDVTNAWMNRLIAEAARPTGELFAPTTTVYAPDAPPRSAGLTGPVRLRLAGL